MHEPEPSIESFAETFGNVLRRLRKARRLHQIHVATEANVDHSLISRWETGSVLPGVRDLDRIASALNLSYDDADELRYSLRRTHEQEDDATAMANVDACVDSLRVSVDCVRALRKAGHPRMALSLGRRDADQALDFLRSHSWSSGHIEALTVLSELLLEECKAGLDYMPRDAVRNGKLAETLRRQAFVGRPLGKSRAAVFHNIAQEGVAYVGGNVGNAHDYGLPLLASLAEVPIEWVPEVIRASAINAGVLDDPATLALAASVFEKFRDSRHEFRPGTHAFVLEGLARGWSRLDPRRANEIIQGAWILRESAGDAEASSSLRFVQLVRSQAQVELELKDGGNFYDTSAKITRALEISRREKYDKYVIQLEHLDRQMSRPHRRVDSLLRSKNGME